MAELSPSTSTVLATISDRRSVRAFIKRPVPTEAITAILAAAAGQTACGGLDVHRQRDRRGRAPRNRVSAQ
jgi:nitroreductase